MTPKFFVAQTILGALWIYPENLETIALPISCFFWTSRQKTEDRQPDIFATCLMYIDTPYHMLIRCKFVRSGFAVHHVDGVIMQCPQLSR